MAMYYIVRKAFRDRFGMHTTGSVTEPECVRGFKYKISDGSILVVDEHNYEDRAAFFKAKFGITIPTLGSEEPKAEEPKAEEPKAEEPKAEEPKAEELKAEEPKAEEPKAEEPKAEEQSKKPIQGKVVKASIVK